MLASSAEREPAAAARDLRKQLGLPALSDADLESARRTLPQRAEAARAYAEGNQAFRRGELALARGAYERALALEPEHPLVLAALADVWRASGYRARAREAARRTVALSASLPAEARPRLEALSAEAEDQWLRAAQAYRVLVAGSPEHREHGVRLVESLARGGKPADARAELARLRKLGDDPRLELAACLARLEDVCARAEAGARDRRSAGLAALEQAAALARAGEPPGAALERAAAALADPIGKAEIALAIAQAHAEAQGETERTLVDFHDALARYREAGEPEGEAASLDGLGVQLAAMGKLDVAASRLEQALELAQRHQIRVLRARVETHLADVLLARGRPRDAALRADKAVQALRQLDAPAALADALDAMGRLQAALGRLDEARQSFQAALDLHGEHAGPSLEGLALVELAADRLDAAEKLAERAVSAAGRRTDELRALALLARVHLRLESKEKLAADAARARALGLAAPAIQALGLMAQGDEDGALAMIEDAVEDSEREGRLAAALDLRMLQAELELWRGQRAAALKLLEALQKDAADLGFEQLVHDIHALR